MQKESLKEKWIACTLSLVVPLLFASLFMKTWEWFVLPVFPSLPAINIAEAIGLTMFLGVLKMDLSKMEVPEERPDVQERMAKHVLRIMALLVGIFWCWLIHLALGVF